MEGAEKGSPQIVANKALVEKRKQATEIICWCIVLILTKIPVCSTDTRTFSEGEEEDQHH